MVLNEQTILITGAAGAIGSYLAKRFSDDGAKVIAVDINPLIHEIFEDKSGVNTFVCDLNDPVKVHEFVLSLYNSHPVTVLINNAGLIHSEPLVNLLKRPDGRHDPIAWNRTIQSNLNTAFLVGASVAEQMVRRRLKGLLINVSSVAAHGNMGQSAYAAAKAGIEAMTVTWAKELGMFGIRSNAIAPGFFNTSSTSAALSESVINNWISSVPLKRLGMPEELYGAFCFVISNDYYNGQVLELNGGLRI